VHTNHSTKARLLLVVVWLSDGF